MTAGSPFFSIAIPTKNRPDRLRQAITSVLQQSFSDLEVIVCDNSDQEFASETAEVVRSLDDARLRYIKTSGDLSMPDNWERAVAETTGQYVGVLTDRSVFRPDAMEVVHSEIERNGAMVVSWFNDLYGRDETGTELKRRACTGKRYRHDKRIVLDFFLNGDPKWSPKIIPKLMTSVCHHSVLDQIRQSAVGRCCPPVAPDFTSGFLMLAHVDWILTLDEAMYVSCGTGNGADFRRRGELAERFRSDLNMDWSEMVDRMPSEACFAHALVLNDFLRIRDLLPDRFPDLRLNRAQYYIGCLNDYSKTARRGVKRTEDLNILLAALAREEPDVQRTVRATRVYRRAERFFSPSPLSGTEEAKISAKEALAIKVRNAKGDPYVRSGFASVFDAMAWDRAHPRAPSEESFLDTLPGIDQPKKKRPVPPPAARTRSVRKKSAHAVKTLRRRMSRERLRRRTERSFGSLRRQLAVRTRLKRVVTRLRAG